MTDEKQCTDCEHFEDTFLCVECADDWGREIAGLPPVDWHDEREKRREELRVRKFPEVSHD